ncbi:MAG: di-trans,poly-cis-decaprenylcistransferase [Candidatus Altiarchaeales archaeon]|nr:MAG: di-trans,poly-cis-decaprenylcistransferase [Candidatus Altiarchaeales archaeon]RLI93891.1 MAG: di-trans,poly-cis-decaprenylcistransferase [Candidatus Altiarchaeales archaeon]RLI94514.1 MAG: di-trans,poly-cis-decaprenylcistransferase [Candidatus Altiarchaeales archaeon]HDO82260.1 di-trans,poly-cis-decaprenylcistransferase [Candidatus Altiarchaeales archaeon]HEX54909.1 di-trans,poly-cis-decaprenylcistransferase [Candidatus Altiarchaeales archaeon]
MHIGLIPDGNRRYMRKVGIKDIKSAYRMGIDKFYDFLEWCIDLNVKELTIYTLSIENIERRSNFELNSLLRIFRERTINAMNDERIHGNRIHVKICGDIEYLRKLSDTANELVDSLERLGESTKHYNDFTLNLAIAYGGRQEIVNAVRRVIENGLELNEENIVRNLWIRNYPDIIIRTAESRLSNFLLWQSAYSEIYFVNKLWQEIEKDDLINIINDFNTRERRFGK